MDKLDKTIGSAVYACVVEKGSFVLADITERTGYSTTTVAKYVDDMVLAGKIEAKDVLATGSRGRKPIVYGIKYGGKVFLGIDIRNDSMSLMLMTLSGEKVGDISTCAHTYENTANKVEEVCVTVEEYLKEKGVNRENILQACLVMGGRINSRKGTSSTRFNFEELGDTPLAIYLEERLGFPVMLENDNKAMTFAEYWMMEKKVDNMLFVNFSWGIGLGIVIDGNLYQGSTGYSGEFGHIHSYDNNVFCQCGKKGCLETEVSGSAIQRHLVERIKQGERSILANIYKKNGNITLEDIIYACEKEDEMCIDQISLAGMELGIKLSDLINIFNPDCIVIGGLLTKAGSYYLMPPIQAAIRKYSLKLISRDVTIKISQLGSVAGVTGGCLLARKRFLDHMTE